MIIIVHDKKCVLEIFWEDSKQNLTFNKTASVGSVFKEIAIKNPEALIIWVYKPFKAFINVENITSIFHHRMIMASYSVNGKFVISEQIGYIENKPYANVSRTVKYPTWQMSSDIGGIYAKTFNTISKTITAHKNFDFFITSVAKHNMTQGLLCYSNPLFLKKNIPVKSCKEILNNNYLLFKFVKQNYKWFWVFNLFLCYVLFEKKGPIFPFLYGFCFKQNKKRVNLNPLTYQSSLKVVKDKSIDVIIPTIGRKDSLYDVLKDLSKQTFLPKHVIIVEQNPLLGSKTELDYLANQEWPFKIIHKFIHQTGACNARNLALSFVKSAWVLLGDDDNRFDTDLIERLFKSIEKLGVKAATTMYVQPNEESVYLKTNQTDIFGSGNSIIKAEVLKEVAFDMAFEFGYGEDSDFGMQLRKTGYDVIYFPEIKITHLKLPFGGFRTKYVPIWSKDNIQPKPAPTIMVLMLKHFNNFQRKGYMYVLFFKFYKKQRIKNPFVYLKRFKQQWKRSEYWGMQLLKNES